MEKIIFVAIVKQWFDKVNGNTYHSVTVLNHLHTEVSRAPYVYGYGTQYERTIIDLLQLDYRTHETYRQAIERAGIFVYVHSVSRKRDL